MKKKNIFILTASLVLASAILLAFNTTSEKKSLPCKEGADKCCKKNDEAPTGGAVWESLSRQFITISGL